LTFESKQQQGSAPLEAVFAIVILMVLVLGVIEVTFALYGRNVVAASAHEGARAAIERGRSPTEAIAIARGVVEQSAGGLIDDLDVSVTVNEAGGRRLVRVRVGGVLELIGPVPVPLRVSTVATASSESSP
jgi:hypothetical protein